MIDIKFLRENPEVVKENIKKKFQDSKLPLVDEVIELDSKRRAAQQEADDLKAKKNQISKQIGALMAQGKKEEAEEVKKEVAKNNSKIDELTAKQTELEEKVTSEVTLAISTYYTPYIEELQGSNLASLIQQWMLIYSTYVPGETAADDKFNIVINTSKFVVQDILNLIEKNSEMTADSSFTYMDYNDISKFISYESKMTGKDYSIKGSK